MPKIKNSFSPKIIIDWVIGIIKLSRCSKQSSFQEMIRCDLKFAELLREMTRFPKSSLDEAILANMLAEVDPFVAICLNAMAIGVNIDEMISPSMNLQDATDRKIVGIKILKAMDSKGFS